MCNCALCQMGRELDKPRLNRKRIQTLVEAMFEMGAESEIHRYAYLDLLEEAHREGYGDEDWREKVALVCHFDGAASREQQNGGDA